MPSLDKKFRPKKFSKMLGNEELIEAIEEMLEDRDSFPATILLQGPSGCGKTTISRIISKRLKTENVYELNVADSRRIDDARAIIENLRFAPISGDGKVIVLNEVHRANVDFQNALLEALEEPPDKTHFILCTTNPESLLTTIKTRSTTFTVKHLDRSEIKDLLNSVIKKEKKDVDKRVVKNIITAADGTPRTALVMLNAIINLKGRKKQKAVIDSFNLDENEEIIALCRLLLQGAKHQQVMPIVRKLDQDPEQIRRTILKFMGTVLLSEDNPRAALIINNFWEPVFYTGKPGIIGCVYNTITEGEE
jgi:DNA polymerase-3 subunit gamma/tau